LLRGKASENGASRHLSPVLQKGGKKRAPSAKDERSPLKRGGFLVSGTPPIGKT
jgi:hypothetical protein